MVDGRERPLTAHRSSAAPVRFGQILSARTLRYGIIIIIRGTAAAKSAGRRTPRKGIVTGGVNFDNEDHDDTR